MKKLVLLSVLLVTSFLLIVACVPAPVKGADLDVENDQVILLDKDGNEIESWDRGGFLELLINMGIMPQGQGLDWLDNDTVKIDWNRITADLNHTNGCPGLFVDYDEVTEREDWCYPPSDFDSYY